MTETLKPIAPGGTIGILGGGQLGRMTALAAAQLGYRCHIFTPDAGSSAGQVAAAVTNADYDNLEALEAFAKSIDVATFEFENIPIESLRFIAQHVPVHPGENALSVAQDRGDEKAFLQSIDIPVSPYRIVENVKDLEQGLLELGRPAVLKTARLGYDGKGQVFIDEKVDPAEAFAEMGAARGVLEKWVDFKLEISVIAARSADGSSDCYVPVENQHRDHILSRTIAPARISAACGDHAETIAWRIANALEIVGLLAVEMFVTPDDEILVNEIAPRPHNSGHWTMDACTTSQFEQFTRAVLGLPLGPTARHSDAIMENLIGKDVLEWESFVADESAHMHLYGKHDARPRRKMGHVNRLYPLGSLRNDPNL
ncbi:MAG: 5-(carboxyamino)imidazole ribonucleotide synthase [Rhodospirillaceae bacterium]|jgi:5-(carboxyamino)imidazole ribonucleotide synthase|nr:5-(carboxyamino)imidazole ribonucleotide synthase [Rhodospirillaceae bacterium]